MLILDFPARQRSRKHQGHGRRDGAQKRLPISSLTAMDGGIVSVSFDDGTRRSSVNPFTAVQQSNRESGQEFPIRNGRANRKLLNREIWNLCPGLDSC